MKTILVFISHFIPGYKSGGPVRTISNILNLLSKDYNFLIITNDKDLLENKPYENIKVDQWTTTPNCKVYYKSNKNKRLPTIIKSANFDQYYLNSLFSFNFSIKIMLFYRMRLIPQKPILLAPRGELSLGALSIKPFKKKIFLAIVKSLNLYKNITWHASSKFESDDIKRVFGKNINIKIALDLPNLNLPVISKSAHKKVKGKLKILFISLISPKKNLKFAIDVLNKVEGDFIFDIYGPIKDKKYWRKCLNAVNPNLKDKFTYKGIIPNDQIHTIYPNYELFFFPTLSENYGHVIYESLFYGCPVLCSGTTPWHKLDEFNAGWNIDLSKSSEFLNKISELINYDAEQYEKFIIGCKNYITYSNNNGIIKDNLMLFE